MRAKVDRRLTWGRGAGCLAALLVAAGCGGASSGTMDGAPPDAPGDAPRTDAGEGTDVGPGLDSDTDAAPVDDANSGIDASDDGATSGGDAADASDASLLPLPDHPDIVVVMADDLDRAGFERMLAAGMLPHIQHTIADQGVEFDNFYASNPLCCPSRATFLSGQYSHNNNVHTNDQTHAAGVRPDGGFAAFDDSQTVATWLHAAGYHTAIVGKYLNGYGGALPYGYSGPMDAMTYVPPGWDDWHALVAGTYQMYGFQFNDGGHVSPSIDMYQTDVIAQRAVDVIHGLPRSRPLFLEITTVAPHVELPNPYPGQFGGGVRPPPRYDHTVTWDLPASDALNEADVSDKPAWLMSVPRFTAAQLTDFTSYYRQRLEALRAIDDLVGTVADAQRAAGRLDNTVFVFLSDNGYLLGQHRLFAKQNMYEEAIHLPLLVHMPGMTGARHDARYVVNADLAPTFVALAGGSIPARYAVDGRSCVPLLRGASPAWRNRLPIEHWLAADDEDASPHTMIPTYHGVRTATGAAFANRAFAHYVMSDEVEAYNVARDPEQLSSFGRDTSASSELMSLQGVTARLSTCSGATCRTIEDE